MIETQVRCNCGMKYKSVVGMGRISLLTDYDEKIEGSTAWCATTTGKTGRVTPRPT